MKLEIALDSRDHAILVCDEHHNDIAEFYHADHATVGQSYETALALAKRLVEWSGAPDEQPIAWEFELANYQRQDGTYTGWCPRLDWHKPNVPEDSIRNLRPLYAAPQPTGVAQAAATVEDDIRAILGEEVDIDFSERQIDYG